MSIAHEKYRTNVDSIPLSIDGITPLSPVAGHGRFTPDSPAYPYLLSMPNVRTIANMCMDYNTRMENPYIAVIHTFPRVSGDAFVMASLRDFRSAYILVEFGQMPAADLPVSTASVEQGTVDVGVGA